MLGLDPRWDGVDHPAAARSVETHHRTELAAASKEEARLICLYGQCCPGIDDICGEFGAIRPPGCHCYEMLLGARRFRDLIRETAGTFFLEAELLANFERFCGEVLELHDDEIRKMLFEHYKRVVYVRQPADEDLLEQGREIARFLDLSLDVADADYAHLEKILKELIESDNE